MQGVEEEEIVDRPETIVLDRRRWREGVARRPTEKRIDKCNRVYQARDGNDCPAM